MQNKQGMSLQWTTLTLQQPVPTCMNMFPIQNTYVLNSFITPHLGEVNQEKSVACWVHFAISIIIPCTSVAPFIHRPILTMPHPREVGRCYYTHLISEATETQAEFTPTRKFGHIGTQSWRVMLTSMVSNRTLQSLKAGTSLFNIKSGHGWTPVEP